MWWIFLYLPAGTMLTDMTFCEDERRYHTTAATMQGPERTKDSFSTSIGCTNGFHSVTLCTTKLLLLLLLTVIVPTEQRSGVTMAFVSFRSRNCHCPNEARIGMASGIGIPDIMTVLVPEILTATTTTAPTLLAGAPLLLPGPLSTTVYDATELAPVEALLLTDYTPAATALFNNMKTPASILAAGMVSLGFLAPFRLYRIEENKALLARIEDLKRAYIVVTLISFCSELLAVMWATVAVNQLTERNDLVPTPSVWALLERDFDLEWAATNSHFVLGMIGFMYMVGIRGYVMLLAEGASATLTAAALTGVASALALMVSVVNRGVAAGGGQGVGYGQSIVDLFAHYVTLLYQRATDVASFGPLELTAIVLQVVSLSLSVYAIVGPKVFAWVDKEKTDNPMHNSKEMTVMKKEETRKSSLATSSTSTRSTVNNGDEALGEDFLLEK